MRRYMQLAPSRKILATPLVIKAIQMNIRLLFGCSGRRVCMQKNTPSTFEKKRLSNITSYVKTCRWERMLLISKCYR